MEPVDYVDITPAEIQALIFSYLDDEDLSIASKVCKQWRAVIKGLSTFMV